MIKKVIKRNKKFLTKMLRQASANNISISNAIELLRRLKEGDRVRKRIEDGRIWLCGEWEQSAGKLLVNRYTDKKGRKCYGCRVKFAKEDVEVNE